MEMSVLDVILAVLKNKFVIIAVFVVIFYLNFVNYIYSYRKRPKRIRPKKTVAQPAAPQKSESDSEGDDSMIDDE